jgi:Na+-transporting NADH:ubiquinone oxidoreductase subunit F
VFTSVIFILVALLLLVESKVVQKGDCSVVINDDEEKSITVPAGSTLLSVLNQNNILLPSACGGQGTCAMCKCKVQEGGGNVLPTELAHLTRREKLDYVRLACQVKVKNDLKIRIPEEIFNIKKYHATVVSNQNVATFIKELVLELDADDHLDFNAGAYVQIDVPAFEVSYSQFNIPEKFRDTWDFFNLWELKAESDEPLYRAYSMANTPAESVLRFTIRIATPPPGATDIPPGLASSYIFSLKPGDRVTLSGPFGDFFVKDTEREMCFVGGGAGMAPMRCHIFHQLRTLRTKRKITFWYGARSKKEMFYDEEFKALEAEFENFLYFIALSEPQPEDHWEGYTGFIHQVAYDHYLSTHEDPTEIEYYLCGPPLMLDAVTRMLDDLGVEPEMIAFDKFG